MAPTLLRAALRSSLQSSAAICQISTSSGGRPAALAPAMICASESRMLSVARPRLAKAPSPAAPAACSGLGCEAARKTGGARLIHGRWAVAAPSVAGSPRSRVLMNVTPSARSLARDFCSPTFFVPLWPAPMPRTARPFPTWSSEAIAGGPDGGGAEGGMPGREVGDAERDARPPRGPRHHRRRHPGVHRVARRVGDADHGVAVAIGPLGERLAELEGVGPEEEANLHLALAFEFYSRGGQRRMITPSTTANKSLTTKPNRPTNTSSA